MIETAKFTLFAAVAWALILTPGPDMRDIDPYDSCSPWNNNDLPDIVVRLSDRAISRRNLFN